MKQYPEYKDSGVEWIGSIPVGWRLKKIKYIKSDLPNSFVDGPFGSNLKTEHYIENGDVYVIDSGFITSGQFVFHRDFRTISLEHFKTIKRSECKEDDIILSKIGANFGMAGLLPKLEKQSVVSGNSLKLTVNTDNYYIKFIHYQFYALKVNGEIDLLVKGSAQPALSLGLMNNLIFAIPKTKIEQTQITTFLNYKTHQLNDLIDKKQKLIELLKEERTALINQAVTKGLDTNIPMKESGIEWLGEIPEHWMVKRLKFLVDNIIEKANISDFKVALENIESWTGQYLKTENPAELTGELKSFKPNDVLFNKLRPYLAKVYLPVVEGECVGELLVLRSKTMIIPKFLYYRLLSRDFIEVVNGSTYGAKMPRASWEDFIRNLIIPYPEITEQNKIVESIDRMTMVIANTIVKLEHEIELIAEYKTSLINEAVTGKIDVREYKINASTPTS